MLPLPFPVLGLLEGAVRTATTRTRTLVYVPARMIRMIWHKQYRGTTTAAVLTAVAVRIRHRVPYVLSS